MEPPLRPTRKYFDGRLIPDGQRQDNNFRFGPPGSPGPRGHSILTPPGTCYGIWNLSSGYADTALITAIWPLSRVDIQRRVNFYALPKYDIAGDLGFEFFTWKLCGEMVKDVFDCRTDRSGRSLAFESSRTTRIGRVGVIENAN